MKAKNISGFEFVKDKILGFNGSPQKPMYFIKTSMIEDHEVSIFTTGELSYLKEFERDSEQFRERSGIDQESDFILLTINNFPYDLEEGVHHWLVWSNKHYDLTIIQSVLK